MNKFFMTAVAIMAVVFTNAQTEQTFKPFKVDIAVGYALPAGGGSKAGALFAIEPKYALNDNLAVGLRIEAALTAQGNFTGNETSNGDVKASSSYLATVDYYLNTNGFRPFIGTGAGIFTNASANMSVQSTSEVKSGSKFGFAPRIGFEAGHFRTAIEYNFAGKTQTIDHNYLGLKIGFFLGGGRYEQ